MPVKRPETIIVLPNEIEIGIDSLDPEKIKLHASNTQKRYKSGLAKTSDGTIAGLTTIQNNLVRALGPFQNFSNYRGAHWDDVQKFLKTNDLHLLSDLITKRRWSHPSQKGDSTLGGAYGMLYMNDPISHQSLSERLFLSGKPLPERVFTGYDFDYWSCFEDGDWILSSGLCNFRNSWNGPHGLRSSLWSENALENNIELALRAGDTVVDIPGRSDHPSRKLIDIVLGGHLDEMAKFHHLLRDTMVRGAAYQAQQPVMKNGESVAAEPTLEDLFRYRIDGQDKGWIGILPFNEDLIFLKGSAGEYDFLVRHERDCRFNTRVYGPDLPARQVPAVIPDYSFEHWYHFDHNGWKENEHVEARAHYARRDRHDALLPDPRMVLRDYYTSIDKFQPRTHSRSFLAQGFHDVQIQGQRLAISDLITIENLLEWLSDPRTGPRPTTEDPLLTVNADNDNTLPASVTWNAAMSYARYVGTHLKLPLRLLTFAELRELRESEEIEELKNVAQGQPVLEPLLCFFNQKGEPFDGHPPYMPEEDFGALQLKYLSQPCWVYHKTGVRWVDSTQFGEWVHEKACLLGRRAPINQNCGVYSVPVRVGQRSTGKYKGIKIGFRLCYEITAKG